MPRSAQPRRCRARPDHAACTVSKKIARCASASHATRKPSASDAALPVDALGDPTQPLGSVVDGVHPGDDREQDLRRADVARRLLAADVLLAGLQGEAVRRCTVGVDRHADEATGQLALEPGAHGHEPGVRPAEAERYAEALRRADRDVGTDLARGAQQRQREQVGGHRHQRALIVCSRDQICVVTNRPRRSRVLHEHAEALAGD